MVNFTVLPIGEVDVRVAAAHRAQFLSIGQLIKWELTDASGAYSGLMIVGEKAIPDGFQTMANMTIDVGAKPLLPEKLQELSRVVNAEFAGRTIMSYDAGSSKKQ
jgi:hypothetical protein